MTRGSERHRQNDAVTGDERPPTDVRRDPVLGTIVHVVGHRQTRPNLPGTDCPFCVGGLEAAEPYDVRWFTNRWPAMPDDRCEVVLFSPDHEASLATLGASGIEKVIRLWADRSAVLGARPDVAFVLVFENRGSSVGATISHPHGQIYAYDHVPERPRRLFAGDWVPESADERLVVATRHWTAHVPIASEHPTAVSIAPRRRVGDLPSLSDDEVRDLATMLADIFARLDRLFGEPLPYMAWINQRPFDDSFVDAWLSIDIVSPWRRAGLPRYIAAAEIGAGEFFNPVVPEDLAARLRDC